MSLSAAIQWRWPGAQCVVRNEVLERWDGPMARPTDVEIAQALIDYAADPNIPADATAQITRADKDRLASLATAAEAYNPAWATMTNAQKRQEVVRLAKRWEQHRNWVTRNYEFMVW
jgi:hypothetical protein